MTAPSPVTGLAGKVAFITGAAGGLLVDALHARVTGVRAHALAMQETSWP